MFPDHSPIREMPIAMILWSLMAGHTTAVSTGVSRFNPKQSEIIAPDAGVSRPTDHGCRRTWMSSGPPSQVRTLKGVKFPEELPPPGSR